MSSWGRPGRLDLGVVLLIVAYAAVVVGGLWLWANL